MTKIYDCFTFFNELDLLEIRLNELYEVVDRFVIVEGTKTFSNNNKELFFEKNKERFKIFLPKIIHIVVSDWPVANKESRWNYESHQRNAILRGLTDCNPQDQIIISDVDEIVNHQVVLPASRKWGIKYLEQKIYYYKFNLMRQNKTLRAAKMVSFRHLSRSSPQGVRGPIEKGSLDRSLRKIKRLIGLEHFIQNAGWHFSYLGDEDFIKTKLASYSHKVRDAYPYNDENYISGCINRGLDLFSRSKHEYTKVDLDNTFPKHILENKQMYNKYIY